MHAENSDNPNPSSDFRNRETISHAPAQAHGSFRGDSLPNAIGSYKILETLGEGGMGVVYLAEQEKPRRTVALKVIRPGYASPQLLKRFEQESQVLGRLQHPGIAQIYEAGTHEIPSVGGSGKGVTVPYFAMEFIRGRGLKVFMEAENLGTRQRLELVTKICDAVHHAHQKGVIHRDLKPGNILVDESGQPKILDFGVARATDSDIQATTIQTDIGQLIGTIPYMSPEQVAADPQGLDTRSDVYALGVIAYEALAGRLPYDLKHKMIHEAARVIREEEPAPLSTVNRVFRGDVETIVAKSLEKDKTRRYQSAAELASDIRRYLHDEPIVARPASAAYQFKKFAQRHKAVVVGVTAVFLVLVAGIIVSTSLYLKADRAAKRAMMEASKSRQVATFMKDMLKGVEPSVALGRDTTMLREILDRTAERVGTELASQPEVEADLRTTLGRTYMELGLFEQAEQHLRSADTTRSRELGDEHPDTLRTRTILAELLPHKASNDMWHDAEYSEADRLLHQTLETQRRVLGDEHPDTLKSMQTLATSLIKRGKPADAEALQGEVLQIRRRVLGDEHPDTLESMRSMVSLLMRQAKEAEAEALLRQVLEIQRQVLGDRHPDTLHSIHGLAWLRSGEGNWPEAEALWREKLQIQRQVLGNEHPDTLYSMQVLAQESLETQGKWTEAETLLREVLKIRRRLFGDDHPDTVVIRDILAGHLAMCEPADPHKREEALALSKETIEKLDRDRTGVSLFLHTLALAYRGTGDLDMAIETQRKAVALPERRNLWTNILLETMLIGLLREKGDYEAAESMLREVLAVVRKAHGEDHAELVRRMTELGLFLAGKAKYKQQLTYYINELIGARQGVIAQDKNGMIANVVVGWSSSLIEQGKHAEAEPLLRHVLSIRQAAYPEGDCRIAHVMTVLGASLTGQGKYAEAEPLLIDGYNQMKDNPDAPVDRVHEALERIVNFYEAREAAEPGQGHAEKAAEWQAQLKETPNP